MTMLTVDDLARDLKVRNEDLLRELVMMGYDVNGPESPLQTDDPAALRAQLVTVLPQREVVEKRIKPTVIRRRAKNPPPGMSADAEADETSSDAEFYESSEKEDRPQSSETATPKSVDSQRKPLKKFRKPEPARIIEMAPKPVSVPEPEIVSQAVKTDEAEISRPLSRKTQANVQHEYAGRDRSAQPSPEGEESLGSVRLRKSDALEKPAEESILERPDSEPQSQTHGDDKLSAEERLARKKKKKDRRMQPAQIIGRVELKREPPPRVEREQTPAAIIAPPPPPRPQRTVEKTPLTPSVIFTVPVDEDEARKKKRKDKKGRTSTDDRVEEDRVNVRRRKEVILGSALYDDRNRPFRARGKAKKLKKKTEITTPRASKRRVRLTEQVSVSSLAHKMSVKGAEVIQHLLTLGVTSSINENIDFETATLVANEFGFEAEPTERSESELLPEVIKDTEENLLHRPPVVTVMGHVDHGKTSLLDKIRSSHVTEQEAGGITQHMGAYKVKLGRGDLVFLDTPGHEAFTAMRARGAQVTDFVILVVAADDGVMDQTREAINHARAASVPIIVAVNKIDKPEADKDRVLRELSEQNLIPESWGGDTLFTFVSAKTGEGVDELLELIVLQAEMMELRANPDKKAVGTIIEARLDKGKGPVATVLIREGTLRLGDAFVAGIHYGKVRAMLDHEGRSLTQAGPADPVEVQGFSGIPEAGDSLDVVDEDKRARQIGLQRQEKIKAKEVIFNTPASIEDLMARLQQQQDTKDLNLIIKADVQGSAEAVKESLAGLSTQEVKVKVIHCGVGGISDSDVMLASASNAMIIGFNVRTTPKTSQLAEQEKVDIRMYTIIYEAIEDVRKAMEGMLAPIEKETVVGRVEVRQTFLIRKVGTIAGCYVLSGKIERSSQVRLLRDSAVVFQGRISSLKRLKDDVKEALEGYECGILLENYNDIKVGDIIEAFSVEKESAKLS
jgi:translation initiation factor IF-2